MYAIPHERTDSLLVQELRVTTCGRPAHTRVVTADALGLPLAQLKSLLLGIARDTGIVGERPLREKMTRVIDAQFPGQYCEATVWTRTVFVDDAATQRLRAPMRRAVAWAVSRIRGE